MMNTDKNKQIGMYIHIPFCIRKCKYCDFVSEAASDFVHENYINALIDEINGYDAGQLEGYGLRSVFIGGGTPSAVKAEYISRIMTAVKEHFADICGHLTEITIECNPGTVTAEKLRIYRDAGINRLSFGLQSAIDSELECIGRIHTWDDFKNSYRLAHEAGFENVNVDLMFDLPDQTMDTWKRTLADVCALEPKPSHISAYSLILEEGTPLAAQIESEREQGIDRMADEDTDRAMYHYAQSYLAGEGYHQYEISNFAMPSMESIHNLSYWECKEYIGFGVAAASNKGDLRCRNTYDIDRYIAGAWQNKEDIEHLTGRDRMSEFVFLGLRMTSAGVDTEEFKKRFAVSFDEVFGDVTAGYIEKGLLSMNDGRLTLTPYGIDVSNVIMADYIL